MKLVFSYNKHTWYFLILDNGLISVDYKQQNSQISFAKWNVRLVIVYKVSSLCKFILVLLSWKLCRFLNHSQSHFWDQHVLHNKDKVSCSKKQQMPLHRIWTHAWPTILQLQGVRQIVGHLQGNWLVKDLETLVRCAVCWDKTLQKSKKYTNLLQVLSAIHAAEFLILWQKVT